MMFAVGLIALPDAHADDADAALESARTATVREDFSGVVQIEWLQDGKWQVARVPVNGTGGTVQVGEGTRKAEASDDDRWIAGVSGWQAGWTQPVAGDVPAPSKHWKLALAKGPLVAGRTTNVVVATDPTDARAAAQGVRRPRHRRDAAARGARPARPIGAFGRLRRGEEARGRRGDGTGERRRRRTRRRRSS